jgi:hypothetical protein
MLEQEDEDEWDRIERQIYESRTRPSGRETIDFDEE